MRKCGKKELNKKKHWQVIFDMIEYRGKISEWRFDTMKEEIREIIDYYSKQRNPQEQENIVAMLREIQEAEGCITVKVQETAAEALGVKRSVLSCIIKRYPSLKEADYAHEVVLCTGKSCQCKNSM